MKKISVQVQSVLYHNEKKDLMKAIENINNALRIYSRENEEIECWINYGDASKNPIFSDKDIRDIEKKCPFIKEIKYTFFEENTGTAKGHNRLGEKSQSDYIMVMNPDVLVTPRFFIEMLSPFSDEMVGLTEARQTPIEHPKEYDVKTFETSWSTTACVIFPTHIFELVKGFDEKSFFMYCDDVDFSWRIRLAGYKLIYRPGAVVFHAKRLSASGAWQPTEAEKYYSAEAALMMAYKWSHNERLEKLVYDFKHSKEEIFVKAVTEFKRKQKAKELPEQLDKEHRISTFVGGEYSKHRFVM